MFTQMGLGNGSIPNPQPRYGRKMFGAYGQAPHKNSVLFVSQTAYEAGISKLVTKRCVPVKNCRNITKKNMLLNDLVLPLSINPQTYKVLACVSSDQPGPSRCPTVASQLNTATDFEDGFTKEEQWQNLTCPPANAVCLARRYHIF